MNAKRMYMGHKKFTYLVSILLLVGCSCFVNGCKKAVEPAPTETKTVEELKVTADSIGTIGPASAIFSGKVTAAVNTVTDRGVYYGSSPNPTENKTPATSYSTNGVFSVELKNLKPSTAYYIRGYATNNSGTVYTKDLQFTTKAAPAAQAQVVTDTLFATGVSTAFVAGSAQLINGTWKETGICIGKTPQPTINDRKVLSPGTSDTKFFLRINGLQEATGYYIRAFGTDDKGNTYYGKNVILSTIVKGNVTWHFNWEDPDADAATKEAYGRIRAAFDQAVALMNNFTSITKDLTVSYSPGTPTADGSISGWINMGPNAAYQHTGTALHEINHTVGVGTSWMWPQLMVNGSWQGYNANKNLQFLTRDPNARISGDTQHFWPFGVNGAWEDTGVEMDYIITCLIIQGMKSDGLPSSN